MYLQAFQLRSAQFYLLYSRLKNYIVNQNVSKQISKKLL